MCARLCVLHLSWQHEYGTCNMSRTMLSGSLHIECSDADSYRNQEWLSPTNESRYSSSIWRWGGGTEALR